MEQEFDKIMEEVKERQQISIKRAWEARKAENKPPRQSQTRQELHKLIDSLQENQCIWLKAYIERRF